MLKGFRRPLMMEDLYELPDDLHSHVLSERLSANWDKELELHREWLKHADADGNVDPSLKLKRPSLLRAIWRTFGFAWTIGGLFRLVSDSCQVVAPIVLQKLIAWFTATAVDPDNAPGVGYGYGLACILLALQLILSFFVNQYFYATMKVGFSIRAAIIVQVYRKRASSFGFEHSMSTDASRLDLTAPFLHLLWAAPIVIMACMGLLIANLGASALVGFFFLIIVFPAQGVLMKYLVKIRTKANKITDTRVKRNAGLEVPGRADMRSFQVPPSSFYEETAKQGWEQAALSRIANLRDEELSFVRIMIMARAWVSAVMQIQPVFAAILTFITYTQTNPPGSLTAALAFSSIGLFNVLRLPLMFLPQVATQATDALVSIGRLESLLLASELQERTILPENYVPPEGQDEEEGKRNWAVRVHGGIFVWDQATKTEESPNGRTTKSGTANGAANGNAHTNGAANGEAKGAPTRTMTSVLTKSPTAVGMMNGGGEKKFALFRLKKSPTGRTIELSPKPPPLEPQLRGVDFVLPKGGLMMVVGPVGSGKSSLMAALVGEMRRVEGLVEVRGSVAYCPQQAWIQNATVRDNILFGQAFNERKYWETIRACAMERDLEILADGDFTEIGERGITLSGGQKQRISIARAVYSNSDVVLLDDPLSAVDAHVGRHIFDQCICGSLAGKTRILSTHQLHILPQADWVVCVQNGDIVEQGTYFDLLAKEGGYLSGMVKEYGSVKQEELEEPGHQPENHPVQSKAAEKQLHDLAKTKRRAGTKGKDGTLMSEEEKMEGAVSFKVYKDYFSLAGGWPVVLGLVTALGLTQGARIATDSWLSAFTSGQFGNKLGYFSGVYVAWGTSQGIAVLVTGYLFATGCIWASRRLHAKAAERLFRAPISFFDTTPVGRIMNRFSKDIDSVDNVLPETLRMATSTFSLIFATLILIGVVLPIFFAPLVPLLGVFASSLVFGAAVIGVAAGRSSMFGPSVIGLALTYSLNVTGTLNWMVRQLAETEMQMNGVERLIYYSEDLDVEAAMVIEDNRPPELWPSRGEIVFKDLEMRYRPDLPVVLKKINLHINAGEKVGFVGRTGAGKSSIMIALFRLSEMSGGSIVIDGVNISQIGLNDLRSRLAIIPQDPVLFSGTVRYNLDPFDEYEDSALWDVLSRSGDLKDVVEKNPDKLEMVVSENGENFSVGQLKEARVVVMDEATASVDLATDDLIQKTIRTDDRFKGKTVLTIAHRLNTIVDYDKVVVMSDGNIGEYGSPKELASNKDGLFRKLIDETGPENAKVLLRLAGVEEG
ncbi:hypothetical protein HDU93_006533 [Gonapodya sp. JEL0774]|nr:hypothetical protein HDU93_006533 [Gonapodya sp. JEL0774]